MGRLVVSHILPGHTHTVDVVVHQRHHAVFCGYVGGKDVEHAGIAAVKENHLLAPVAKDVGLQTGIALGVIDRS